MAIDKTSFISVRFEANCLSILIVVVRPAMRVTSVEQRTPVVRKTAICESSMYQTARHAMLTRMVWMVEVPVGVNQDAAAICVVRMVAHRTHLLGLAGLENIVAVHHTLHINTVHLVAMPFEIHLESLRTLGTKGSPIAIPVPTGPLVCHTCVHDCKTTICAPSIEVCTNNLVNWHTVSSIVVRV
jgi:hypothetical protein